MYVDLLSRRRNRFSGAASGANGANSSSTPVSTARQQRQRDQRNEQRRLEKLEKKRREEEARLRRKHGLDPTDENEDYDDSTANDSQGYTSYRSRFYVDEEEEEVEAGVEERECVVEGEELGTGSRLGVDDDDDEIDADCTPTNTPTCNDSRIADFIGAKDSESKNAMKEGLQIIIYLKI